MKIKKDVNAWQSKLDALPAKYDCIGFIEHDGIKGVLLKKHGRTGPYFLSSKKWHLQLDGNKVSVALGTKGRPKNDQGVRVTLTLDAKTIDKAKKLGSGNISAGLRAWGAK